MTARALAAVRFWVPWVVRLVVALWRFRCCRLRALPADVRGPRFFVSRAANCWHVFLGPVWLTIPIAWSQQVRTSHAAPWLAPTCNGILHALGMCGGSGPGCAGPRR